MKNCKAFLATIVCGGLLAPAPSSMADTLLASSTLGQPPKHEVSAKPSDALSTFNNSFRENYSEAKKEIRENLGPIIILNSDMTLIRGDKRLTASVIPTEYTVTKTIDHITLDIFVILTNDTDHPLSQATRKRLEVLKELVLKSEDQVKASDLPAASVPRQFEIINKSLEFVTTTLKNGQVSSAELKKFTRSIAPLTLKNVDEAVAAALARTDGIVEGWRKDIPIADWNNLYVIVASGHMPREQNSFMQYFEKLLKQKREGDRIIYFEGDYDEQRAIDLLVTHILDRRIAIDFYKDPWRMHRDLLSDGAHKYLSKHPPHNVHRE